MLTPIEIELANITLFQTSSLVDKFCDLNYLTNGVYQIFFTFVVSYVLVLIFSTIIILEVASIIYLLTTSEIMTLIYIHPTLEKFKTIFNTAFNVISFV